MAYYLFLDDERKPHDVKWKNLPLTEWTIVRSYEEFVKTITEKGVPAFVSFDHDLAPDHYAEGQRHGFLDFHYENTQVKTGYDCARWLCEYCRISGTPIPAFEAHTLNTRGEFNIACYLSSWKHESSDGKALDAEVRACVLECHNDGSIIVRQGS